MLRLDCPIYLASGSPRRKEILSEILDNFTVLKLEVTEAGDSNADPSWITMKNALRKFIEARKKIRDASYWLISADTVVSINQSILGKPLGRSEAIQALSKLQGQTHQVYSGVVVGFMRCHYNLVVVFSEKTAVTFQARRVEEIEAYVDRYKPYDKAGSYGIQELPKEFVKDVQGDLDNVVGLPKLSVLRTVRKLMLEKDLKIE